MPLVYSRVRVLAFLALINTDSEYYKAITLWNDFVTVSLVTVTSYAAVQT